MSPESRNFKSEPSRLPRAAVALAALSVFAAGCGGAETGPTSPTSASQTVESHGTGTTGATHTPDHNQASASTSASTEQGDKPKEQQKNDQAPKPDKSSKAPVSTPSPDIASLIFKVTGSCHMDGELENWSKNFTPYGSTHNEVIQPDGTMYEGVINDQVDGLGHSQWNVTCSDFAQEGDYKGLITDLGPDNAYGTADDRSVPYTFGISNS